MIFSICYQFLGHLSPLQVAPMGGGDRTYETVRWAGMPSLHQKVKSELVKQLNNRFF